MLNKRWGLLTSAALLAMLSACATTEQKPGVSDIDRSRTSLCVVDRLLSYEAGEPGEADPENILDSAPTVAEIRAHNARFAAACPQ